MTPERGRHPGNPWAVRIVAVLARGFPQRETRTEVVAAFGEGYQRRRLERGRVSATAYTVRSAIDVARAGVGERWRAWRTAKDRAESNVAVRPGRPLLWDGLVLDVRYALRALRRSPAFTIACVVVLALGTGGNTAAFSALKTVVLADPPYPEPDRLVVLRSSVVIPGQADPVYGFWSYPWHRQLEELASDAFEGLAAYGSRSLTLEAPGQPERVGVQFVSPKYLALLGVQPVAGRLFSDDEGERESPPVAILSHDLWTSRFGGDPGAVGATIRVRGQTLTVVGVLPVGFRDLPGTARLWVPVGMASTFYSPAMLGNNPWLHIMGRLRAEVALADADGRVRGVVEELQGWGAGEAGGWRGVEVVSLREARTNSSARTSVLVLTSAAGLVLLIAVANLGGLLLARSVRRRGEAAVRVALGSGAWRLTRGMLVEGLLLAFLGGLAGLAVAWWGIRAITMAWPEAFTRSSTDAVMAADARGLTLDPSVLAFSLVVTVLVGVVFGVLPARIGRRFRLAPALSEGGRGAFSSRRTGLRGLLVSAQAALALVLLVGASLLGRTFLELQAVDRGFDPDRLLTFGVSGVGGGAEWTPFLARVDALPGVIGVAAGQAPYSGFRLMTSVGEVEGRPPFAPTDRREIAFAEAGPGYFELLGARLLSGRTFGVEDEETSQEVVILNQTAVRTLFEGSDPVGRYVAIPAPGDEGVVRYRVVGVVADLLQTPPDRDPVSMAYLPMVSGDRTSGSVLVRTEEDPFEAVPLIREVVADMAPGTPVVQFTTVEQLGAAAVADTRLVLSLLGLFAATALTLAATGLYGLVSLGVAERRRELGLRMALGARGGALVASVVARGMGLTGLGVLVGLGVAWSGSRVLSSLLFGVAARDPASFAIGAVVLLVAGGLASVLPARRAVRLDPSEVLRAE